MTEDALREFERCLAAVVRHPGLDAVLLVDAGLDGLLHSAARLSSMLSTLLSEPVSAVLPRAYANDDDLWGVSTTFAVARGGPDQGRIGASGSFGPTALCIGPLLREDLTSTQPLIVVPDLASVGRPMARSMLQFLGEQSIHFERHGRSRSIRNESLWLAGCSRADLQRLPQHLLERFPVRLHLPKPRSDRTERLLAAFDCSEAGTRGVDLGFDEHWMRQIVALPSLSTDAMVRLRAFLDVMPPTSIRRDLAFARLTVGLAILDGNTEVSAANIDEAGGVFGLEARQAPPQNQPAPPLTISEIAEPVTPEKAGALPRLQARPEVPQIDAAELVAEAAALELDGLEAIECSPAPPTPQPAHAPGESAPLQILALRSPQAVSARRGEIIGSRPLRTGEPIAIIPTLLEALQRQMQRRIAKGLAPDRGLLVLRDDLRTWRRAPHAEYLLAVVLDRTALSGVDWIRALIPFFADAYQKRASISLTLVGTNTKCELRAETLDVRSILVPRLRGALDRPKVKATPLAHGLILAQRRIETALHRGRDARLGIRLLVLTDGRGNVPLQASYTGKIDWPVGPAGVEDACAVARRLGALRMVDIHLLAPRPHAAPQILDRLASSLRVQPEFLSVIDEVAEGRP